MKFVLVGKQSGSALMWVLVTMVVSFLLVSGLVTISMNESYQTLYQSDENKAYYIARAGAESMVKELQRMSEADLKAISDAGSSGLTAVAENSGGGAEVLGGTGSVEVTVTNPGGSGDFLVRSTGSYYGHTETVDIWLYYTNEDVYDIDYAAYSKLDMVKSSGGDINFDEILGDIAAGGTVHIHNNKVGDVSGTITSNYLLDINILELDIDAEDLADDGHLLSVDIDSLGLGNKDTYTLNDSAIIENLDFGNKNTFYINTDNADFRRVEGDDDITMTPGWGGADPWMIVYLKGDSETTGDIVVSGSNNLMIVVDDYFRTAGNNAELTFPDHMYVKIYVLDDGMADGDDLVVESGLSGRENYPEQLEIIMYGDDSVMDFSNNGDFHGKIYAGDGRVDMKNGNTSLYGSVYAEEVVLSAQVDIIYKETANDIYTVGTRVGMDVDHWGR